LKKMNYDTINEQIFDYFFKNSNRKITLDELQKSVDEPIKRSLPKIVNELGFSGDLLRIFFNVSKNAVEFRNPIRKSYLEKIGISKLKINIYKESSAKKNNQK